jgi:hypothetical protein
MRARGVDVLPFPSSRRAVTAAVRAGRRIVPMHGLLDIDVTEGRRLLDGHQPPLSMTAFVIAAVAGPWPRIRRWTHTETGAVG